MEHLNAIKSNIDRFIQEMEDLIESDEAYGSSVNLLVCQVDTTGQTTGRFRDVWNNRIFDYILSAKGLSYKPTLNLNAKLDAQIAVNLFETYSAGYLSAFPRLDSIKKRTKKPKCGNTNYNCGLSCIGITKNCQIDSGLIPRDRINKLQELAKLIAFDQIKLKGVGGGFVKPSDLIKLSRELQKQRVLKTKTLSSFTNWNQSLLPNKNESVNTLEREEAIKDFLTPKKVLNGQIVSTGKEVGRTLFYKGIKDESVIVRPEQVVSSLNTNTDIDDIEVIQKSINELGFNLALPLVSLVNEEDKYKSITGNGIHKAFYKSTVNDEIWVTIIPTAEKNASILAEDYIQQSKLNIPINIPRLTTTKKEAINQLYFDPKNKENRVTFYKKERPQPGFIVLEQLKAKVQEKKYSDQIESEINIAVKSMKELKTNLSAPLVSLTGKDDEYQMLSGELLLEAARRAGLDRLRVMILPTTPEYAAHFIKDFEAQNRASREKSQ